MPANRLSDGVRCHPPQGPEGPSGLSRPPAGWLHPHSVLSSLIADTEGAFPGTRILLRSALSPVRSATLSAFHYTGHQR